MKYKRGFTLIELLVVIAIIGILASVVLVNLNTARLRARNAERIATIDQLRLALQLYYDDQTPGAYPANLAALTTAGYMPSTPTAPNGGAVPGYVYAPSGTGNISYCLGVYLEGTTPPMPGNDTPCDPDGAGAFDAAAANAYSVEP